MVRGSQAAEDEERHMCSQARARACAYAKHMDNTKAHTTSTTLGVSPVCEALHLIMKKQGVVPEGLPLDHKICTRLAYYHVALDCIIIWHHARHTMYAILDGVTHSI